MKQMKVAQWMVGITKRAVLPLVLAGTLGAVSACGPSTPATQAQTCISDDDCELGTVCILMKKECQAVACNFCITGQICYTSDDGSQSCSKPECTNSSQCSGEESCVAGACIEESCTDKSDCPEGQVCDAFSGICKQPPETCSTDFDCPAGLVCKEDGSCAPGCATDSDCSDVMTYCNEASKLCEPGCRTDASCAADQVCNSDRQCECDQSKCPANFFCDDSTNACVERQIMSCDEVTCGENQICDSDLLQCVDRPAGCSTIQGDPNACPPGERCNQATNKCEIATCSNGITQADCDADPMNPVLNTEFCACVQCVVDNDCPTGAGCDLNGQCVDGCEVCDPGTPGACGNDAPFCFNGCCAECTTNSECPSPQVCLSSNRCGDPPSCAVDPSVCPAGTTCMNGTCQGNGNPGNQACNPQDPTSCLPPGMCMETTPGSGNYTCQGGGGGIGDCGMSGCPNGLECVVGQCVGCINDGQCPTGQSCNIVIPLLPGICM